MLDVSGLSKRFGDRRVLHDVSLHVAGGEFVALMGPSGAGKTTLFRCIGRLIEADAGRVRIGGRDITALHGAALRDARRDAALVFQQFNLVRRASVLANVLAGRLAAIPTWRVIARRFPLHEVRLAEGCLARVGLAGFGDRRADTLSGGRQQRVAIARALAQRSRIILADEPVASLDAENASLVLDLLRRLADDDGLAVLCSLHQPALARTYADRIVRLEDGAIMTTGAGAADPVPPDRGTAGALALQLPPVTG